MRRSEYLERVVALKAQYPWLFYGTSHDIDAGWLNLLERLCENLEELVPSKERDSVYFRQVKEKFGRLRVYLTVKRDGLFERLGPLIKAAEEESKNICQFCGASPARLVSHGMVITLCAIHKPFDHAAVSANFEMFTAPNVPVSPTLDQARGLLLAAREELEQHGIESVAVVGPDDDRDRRFAIMYKGTDDPDDSWLPDAELPRILGWPSAVILDRYLRHYNDCWERAGGGAVIPWLW